MYLGQEKDGGFYILTNMMNLAELLEQGRGVVNDNYSTSCRKVAHLVETKNGVNKKPNKNRKYRLKWKDNREVLILINNNKNRKPCPITTKLDPQFIFNTIILTILLKEEQ